MYEAEATVKDINTGNKNRLRIILKVLAAAIILILIIIKVDPASIFSAYKSSIKLLILCAFGLSFVNIYIQYLKWKLVCNSLLLEYDRKKILLSLFYGLSAGSFTPARVGECFGRAVPLSDKPLMQTTGAVVVDKIFSFAVVFIIGSVSFLFYLNFTWGMIALIILPGLFILFFTSAFSESIKQNLLHRLSAYKKFSQMNSIISAFKHSGSEFRIKLTFLSVLFYICFIIQYTILVMAFTNHFAVINYLWSGNLVMFAKTIIPAVSFGELGIREGASVYFLKHFGEPAAAGFNASIFLFLINILLPALTGLILFIKRK